MKTRRTKNTNTPDAENAARPPVEPAGQFVGVVYENPNVDIGRNLYNERVVRIDLRNADFPGVLETRTILSLDAAITLRNMLDAAFDAAGVDD